MLRVAGREECTGAVETTTRCLGGAVLAEVRVYNLLASLGSTKLVRALDPVDNPPESAYVCVKGRSGPFAAWK
jgi:hypothetical protein